MKLNKEEILCGFLYGSSTWPLISWLAVIPGIICAFLWAIGGAGKKLFRRLGVPLVVGISLSFINIWLFLVIPFLCGVVSIGYGMPDKTDKGSALGRFYLKFLPYKSANWATRLTIFVLFNLVMIIALVLLGI